MIAPLPGALCKPKLLDTLPLHPSRLDPAYRSLIPDNGLVLYDDLSLLDGKRALPSGGTAALGMTPLGASIRSGTGYWSYPADAATDAPAQALTVALVFRVNSRGSINAAVAGRPVLTTTPQYAYTIRRDGGTTAVGPYLGFVGNTWSGAPSVSISTGIFYTAVLRWFSGDFVRFSVYETLTGRHIDSVLSGPKFGTLLYAGSLSELRIGRSEGTANLDADVSALIVSPRAWTDAELRLFVQRPFFAAHAPHSRPSVFLFNDVERIGVASPPVLSWQASPATATVGSTASRATLTLEAPHRLNLTLEPLHTIELSITGIDI